MLVRRTLDRYTRYAQTLIVITVSDLDQVLTCGNVKVNKTKFVALSNMKYIYLSPYCEAQGKGRARGLLRKVTQRSFIDYRLSIIDINFPEALH